MSIYDDLMDLCISRGERWRKYCANCRKFISDYRAQFSEHLGAPNALIPELEQAPAVQAIALVYDKTIGEPRLSERQGQSWDVDMQSIDDDGFVHFGICVNLPRAQPAVGYAGHCRPMFRGKFRLEGDATELQHWFSQKKYRIIMGSALDRDIFAEAVEHLRKYLSGSPIVPDRAYRMGFEITDSQ